MWDWIGLPSYVAALKFQFFSVLLAEAVSGGISRRVATLTALPSVPSVTFKTTAPCAFVLAGYGANVAVFNCIGKNAGSFVVMG
jgi:hypothetical protein